MFLKGKALKMEDNLKSLKNLGITQNDISNLKYLHLNYKSVVFNQSACGLWTDKLYILLHE